MTTTSAPMRASGGLLANRRLQLELVVLVAGFSLLMLAPMFLTDFRLNQMGKFLTFAIVAIGIDLLWGYTGMLSLGQGVFFGLGGYAMAMYLKLHASGDALPDFMGWSGVHSLPWFWEPFRYAWFAIPMAVIGPGIVAFLFGYILFRSRVTGVYFSIVTQALALMLSVFLVGQQAYTGGTNGLTNYTDLFGATLRSPDTRQTLYFATVVVLAITYAFSRLVTGSRFGRVMIAVRDDEARARFTGYNVALVKASVFAIAGTLAGIGGALFVPQVGIISPANLGVVPSIEMVLWVAIGGRGTLAGAVVGALAVSWMRSAFSEAYPESWSYFLGAMFIASVVFVPKGIVESLGTVLARLGERAAWRPSSGGTRTEARPGPTAAIGDGTPRGTEALARVEGASHGD